MPLPQLAVFDLAGTTVRDNRDVHRNLQSILADHRVRVSINDVNEVMGIPKPVAIERLLTKRHLGRKPITENWILQIHEQFVDRMTTFYLNDTSVTENEGVSETFSRLKSAGTLVAVNTGFDRATTDPLLSRMGWRNHNLVDWSVTSDEVPRGRPYADMIRKLMRMAGVDDPAHVAKVGDTPSDMQEGTAAGCGWVIGITSGSFKADRLKKEQHTHLIDRIPQVLDIFLSRGAAHVD